jgi:hypothetical protein
MVQLIDRRKWLVVAGLGLAAGAWAGYELLHEEPVLAPRSVLTQTYTSETPSMSAGRTLDAYLKGKGVSDSVAELSSGYGTMDANKKELGDLIIGIGQIELGQGKERYQSNLLRTLTQEDPSDISSDRLSTLRYMFSDKSMAINMLEYCMYPGVFDYLDIVTSTHPEVDMRIIYATLGVPLFKKVDQSKEMFQTIMQRATDQKFKPAFEQMLLDGVVVISHNYFTRGSAVLVFSSLGGCFLWKAWMGVSSASMFRLR